MARTPQTLWIQDGRAGLRNKRIHQDQRSAGRIPAGADAGLEWIELYNDGAEAVSLAGWQIGSGTSSLRVDVVFDAAVTLGPDSYLVVGESLVAGADVVTELSLGNAGANADIIQVD